jgi:hypothetical protein
LGLQPVWSAFGRALVPNLATPVQQVNGVKAVLLIYWLAEGPLKDLLQTHSDLRGYFRLMEGLLEYFLWGSGKGHCFGTRALAAEGTAFQVTSKDGRTAVNGLYQYYRGSCRRAGLLAPDWRLSPVVGEALSGCWSEIATKALTAVLKEPLADPAKALAPAMALAAAGLKEVIEHVFSGRPLADTLRTQLLGEACYQDFARRCAQYVTAESAPAGGEDQDSLKYRVDALLTFLRDTSDAAGALKEPLTHVSRCEPFLMAVQDAFDLMRGSPGATFRDLAQELNGLYPSVRNRAVDFLSLEGTGHTARMEEILGLARAALAGPREFLDAVIRHHEASMARRGASLLLSADGERVAPLVATERSRNDVLKRIGGAVPWDNGYYLYTAGTIYRQLFGEVPHG